MSAEDPDRPTQAGWDLGGLTRFQVGTAAPSGQPRPPTSGASYQLLRIVGSGGMGEVWEALQSSLGRVVAVKRLRGDERDPALERMFLQEALVTGSLDHPNIVPVHDLGVDVDGMPILAMKLVRGRAWSDDLRRDFATLSVEDHLARHVPVLVQVAQAVAFAHARGIIHRDLKPSQVMLGEFGEVLLTDWGLAVCLQAPPLPAGQRQRLPVPTLESATSPAGTVAFMAPEQSETSPAGLGPWTDVYQLGGILYVLLTGATPHASDAFGEARDGRVVPPRERCPDRRLPEDLVALAQQALHPDPQRRVPSASAFVDALRVHLSGRRQQEESEGILRQVRADLQGGDDSYRVLGDGLHAVARALGLWPGNPDGEPLRREVLERYARAALRQDDLALAQALASRLDDEARRSTLLEAVADRRRAMERTRQQRRLFLGATALCLVALAAGAALYTRDQRRARERAARARTDAQALVSFMLGDLRRQLEPVGRLDALDGALQRALAYYEGLPAVDVDDDTRVRRAEALTHIAGIRWTRDEVDGAMDLWRQAIALCEDVLTRRPADTQAETIRARARAGLGEGHFARAEFDPALAHEEAAVAALVPLQARQPDDVALANDLLAARALLGRVKRIRNDLAGARAAFQDNQRFAVRLSAAHPEELSLLESLCAAEDDLAGVLSVSGDHEAAVASSLRALDIGRQLVARDPRDPARRRELATSLANHAGRLHDAGRSREALAPAREALAINEELAPRDPANTYWALDLASSRTSLAGLLVETGDPRAAIPLAEASSAEVRKRFELAPDNAQLRRRLTAALVALGAAQRALGRGADGKVTLQEADTLIAPLTTRDDRFALTLRATALLLLDRPADAASLLARLRRLGHVPVWLEALAAADGTSHRAERATPVAE